MRARIEVTELSTTVKSIMVSNKLDGVSGWVVAVSDGRCQVAFDHNNCGDEVNHVFWFDSDVVKVE